MHLLFLDLLYRVDKFEMMVIVLYSLLSLSFGEVKIVVVWCLLKSINVV